MIPFTNDVMHWLHKYHIWKLILILFVCVICIFKCYLGSGLALSRTVMIIEIFNINVAQMHWLHGAEILFCVIITNEKRSQIHFEMLNFISNNLHIVHWVLFGVACVGQLRVFSKNFQIVHQGAVRSFMQCKIRRFFEKRSNYWPGCCLELHAVSN